MFADQQTSEWKERYKIRAGIEATNSELKRSYGIGKLRVRRVDKVLFAVVCKLTACNDRRWAKAHFAFFKHQLQHFLCTFGSLIRNGQELISVFFCACKLVVC
jgi:nicotinic acid phosphoribosyltransferase